MEKEAEITVKELKWVLEYLKNRIQRVPVRKKVSIWRKVTSWVPKVRICDHYSS